MNNQFSQSIQKLSRVGLTDDKVRAGDLNSGRSLTESTLQSKVNQMQAAYGINLKNFQQIFMVMEYIESDLKKVLQSVSKGTLLEEDHIVTIMYNSLCAINFMHSANLLHRDLKPANLLVDSNCCVRLCDFGLARS